MTETTKKPRVRRRSKMVFYRTEAGLTQEDVAAKLKVHVGTIKRHEAGQGISNKQLEQYAKLYGCKATDLLDDGEAEERTVNLYGTLGADYTIAVSKKGGDIALPSPLGGVELEVVTVSEDIFPMFRKGDQLVFDTGKQFVARNCTGRMCLVEVSRSNIVLGVFANGSRANYFDITRPNGTLLRDKKVLAAYPVKAIFKS